MAQTSPLRRYRYVNGSDGISLSRPAAEASFEDVFRAQYRRLVELLVRVTGDRGAAEELASEALCRLSRRPMLLRAPGMLEAWLYRTAMNLGLDALRMRMRRSRLERSMSIESARSLARVTPLDAVLANERQERVRKVLAAMKPLRARVLVLRSSGFSYQESAEILRLKPASVGTLVARSMEEFEKKYSEWYGSER